MNEEDRKYKWGKYGRGKYVYKNEESDELRDVIEGYIKSFFPNAKIEYYT